MGRPGANLKRKPGFTLLEAMISMAILAVSLLAIFETQGQAINMSNYAKGLTVATLLARSKMIDLEAEIKEKGFGTFEETLEGKFEEEGFQKCRWVAEIKKIEIPVSDLLAGYAQHGEEGKISLGGFEIDASMIQANLQFVSEMLSEAIRELKLTVYWPEGRGERSFSITTHLIEVAKAGAAPVGPSADLPLGMQPSAVSHPPGAGTSGGPSFWKPNIPSIQQPKGK